MSSKSVLFSRLCHQGSTSLSCLPVNMYKLTDIDVNSIYTQEVATSDIDDYLSECNIHENCIGHLKIYDGVLMYPGSMCVYRGTLRDEFYNKGCALVTGKINSTEYSNGIRSLLMSKKGILRGKCCGGNIEDSLRMVICPIGI